MARQKNFHQIKRIHQWVLTTWGQILEQLCMLLVPITDHLSNSLGANISIKNITLFFFIY